MKKKVAKQIENIAKMIPPVHEYHASGYITVPDEETGESKVPYVYTVEVNHKRRLKEAYLKLGMEGVINYLESIKQLQRDREKIYRDQLSGGTDSVHDVPEAVEVLDTDQDKDKNVTTA